MSSKVNEALEEFKEKPVYAVIIVLFALLGCFFWKALALAAATLLVILVIALIAIKVYFRKPGLRSLMREKKQVLAAIKIAEQKYMRRKLSEKDFNKIFKEKQQQLIRVEALIDQQYNKKKEVALSKELEAVQAKKRHILQSLMEEKKRVLKEMSIAEKRYLKRKIDSKTYQALVQKNQEKLIDLEAQMTQLYSEANVQKVMDSLKEKLRELEEQKKKRKEKRQKSAREKELEIAKEIAEQLMER